MGSFFAVSQIDESASVARRRARGGSSLELPEPIPVPALVVPAVYYSNLESDTHEWNSRALSSPGLPLEEVATAPTRQRLPPPTHLDASKCALDLADAPNAPVGDLRRMDPPDAHALIEQTARDVLRGYPLAAGLTSVSDGKSRSRHSERVRKVLVVMVHVALELGRTAWEEVAGGTTLAAALSCGGGQRRQQTSWSPGTAH